VGTISGGIYISRRGLKRSIWYLAIFQDLSLLLFVVLAVWHSSLVTFTVFNGIVQFAAGGATAAYNFFLMKTCREGYKASHFAIATGLMGLSSTLPASFSGFVAQATGYATFFGISFLVSLPGLAILFFYPFHD